MKEHGAKENKMGTMPVKRLIVTMSLPMMISMLVQALYNIVDSFFVAQISEDALTAVTLAFPLQNFMIAVGSGTGVGINALLSKSLGQKDQDKADRAANTGLFLQIFNYILFVIIGLFIVTPFVNSQTDVPVIASYAEEYLKYICFLSFGCFFQQTFERLLQSTGRTLYSMISQLTGAVANIILDPIMIFGLLGFPGMGVGGAALATVTGQCLAALVAMILNIKANHEIHFSWERILHPQAAVVRSIYFVGIPSILMISIGSVMTYLMNILLGSFSSTAQAVFGAYFKIQSFFFMPVFGLNNGLIPVLAYNYGARKRPRIYEALWFSLKLAFAIMFVGMITLAVIPGIILDIFNASEQMLGIGIPALRIICTHLPLAGIAIVLGSVFQAFSKSYFSLVISMSRQLVVLLPVAWLLSLTGVLSSIWWAFPISEVVSVILTFVFFRHVKKTVIDGLPGDDGNDNSNYVTEVPA